MCCVGERLWSEGEREVKGGREGGREGGGRKGEGMGSESNERE